MDKLFEKYLEKFYLMDQKELIEAYEALKVLGFEVECYDAGPRVAGSSRRGCTFRKGDVIVEMTATICPEAMIEEELMDREDVPVGSPVNHIVEAQEAYHEDLL